MFRMKEMRPDQIMIAPERVVKSSYTKEENYRAYKLFSMMDIDGGGSISLRELNRVMMGDMQRYVTCEFGHPDTGIIFGVDDEQCVMIASIEPDSMASKYPFLIPRMRLHRINENFYVKPYDARSLQAVYQQLLRLHDEPIALEFYEPIMVLNKFSCMLDIEVNNQIFSVTLPIGAVYNHHIFCEKVMESMRQTSPMLQFIELKFIPNRRQVIFFSDVVEFRLLFATGPNFRRSCRYALGFSAEDMPYSTEHQGQPMLMDLRLGITVEQMDVLMKELFTLYDEDGSGEFEFEEFRDFYIQYLDTEESLNRLRYYAQFRFRDIERENYVKKLQNERINKLQRREVLRDKYAQVIENQKKKLLEDSYVDKYGLRRRNYRHRTNDRLNYEKLQSTGSQDPMKEHIDEKSGKLIVGLGNPKHKIKMYSTKTGMVEEADDQAMNDAETENDEDAAYGINVNSNLGEQSDQDKELLDEIPPLSSNSSKGGSRRAIPLVNSLSKSSASASVTSEADSEITIDEESVPSNRRKSKLKNVLLVSSVKNDSHVSIPLTRDEVMHEKRQAKKEKQFQQYLRRQKILTKIMEANKALKKLERAKARSQQLSTLSTALMELHYLVKHAILNSVRIENVEEFDMMKAFSLNIHGIVASPGVNFSSAILGQHLEPSSLDVENLPSSKIHPAGSYYYFLRDTHYQAAMTTKRTHLATSFSIDPTRGKNDRVESIGNPEFMHPAFFTADFVRQPTRHSNIALSYTKIMKRKLQEGIQYRMEHGIKKNYDHTPPEDLIPSKNALKVKKVRFLDVTPSEDTEHGKLIGRVTIKSIKINNIPSIHVLERNSPFVKIECGPWKFTTEVYSYAGEYCEWDDLDWMFRIYEPHFLMITASSGTVAKNVLIGKCAIPTPDILKFPRDPNGNIVINGVFTDPDHPEKVKVFGEFEISIFLEPGQEWQWYIRAHDAKQEHKRNVRDQMLHLSKTLPKSSSGLYDDLVPLPFTLQIMNISLFDLKRPVGNTIFGSTWLSKSSLSSIYLVLDTGNQERSTVDYQNAASKQLDETSIEWGFLYWDITIATYEMNLIFKVFSKSGSVGRFVLNVHEIVSKLSKGMLEVEYYGDVKNYPSSEDVTGKIHLRCNVIDTIGLEKTKRTKAARDPNLESEQNDDMSIHSEVETSVTTDNATTATGKRSKYDSTGHIPGDLIYLMLPLIWEVESIEIRMAEGQDIKSTSLFRGLMRNTTDPSKNIKLTLSIDHLKDLKVAYPTIKSETISPPNSPRDPSCTDAATFETGPTKVGNAGSTLLSFSGLNWNLPLRENMKITISLSSNSKELGALHLHSNEFYSFKKNVTASNSVLVYRFLNNGKEICGNVKIRGFASCEQDHFYVDRTIELVEKDYLARAAESLDSPSLDKKDGLEALKADTTMLAGLLDKVQIVPGVKKTEQAVKSHRTGMVMIEKDETPIGLIPPVLLLNHNSSNPKEVHFPVIVSVFEVMVTDLKSVHILKKNSPQATLACGVHALSTKPLQGNGVDGVWTGLNFKFTFDNISQQLRVHLKSCSTTIGECALSAHELLEVRPDNTGMREIFAHLVLHSDAVLQNYKVDVQILGAISKGKVKLSYFLHSQINPLPMIQEVPRHVVEVSKTRFVEYPIAITFYDMTLLNLKSVHMFNKNSPLVKLFRIVDGFSEELFESSVVNFAGSYAKWMNLMWHFILDNEDSVIELRVSSESIVIGKTLVRAGKFLSTVADKFGICDLEFALTSGKRGEFPSGKVRFSFTFEPHVSDEDMLYEEESAKEIANGDTQCYDDENEIKSQDSSEYQNRDQLIASKKRKRDQLTENNRPLTSLFKSDTKNVRSVLMVAMSAILHINAESSNTAKFLVHSLLKHKAIRAHLICGPFFATAELMETVNDRVLSNIALLEKFVVDIETPLKLKIYDPRGRLLGESLFQWDDFTKSHHLIDHHGYTIIEQELVRIDDDYHEVLGLIRIKVKVSHIPTLKSSNHPGNNVLSDGNDKDSQDEVLKHLYKIAPSVDIPFHLRIKKLTVFDLLIDSEMKISMESLRSHKSLGLQLHYENLQWSIVGMISTKPHINAVVSINNEDSSTSNDFRNIDFIDNALLFTVTNEFETWRLYFSLFPFQNVLVGEVLLQVSDWQQALLKTPGPCDNPDEEVREVFTNIFKRNSNGSVSVVGRVCIHFQIQEILFRTMFNAVSSSKKKFKRYASHYEVPHSIPKKLQDPVGYLRVKSISVSHLQQVYSLFKNSPKVTFTAGTEFEGMTDIAWDAGTEHIWENLQWGKINLFEGMPLKFKVTSANEVIGTCLIPYKALLQRVLARSSSSKSVLVISEDLRDGRFIKGKIEMACFLNMKTTPLQELKDLPVNDEPKIKQMNTLDEVEVPHTIDAQEKDDENAVVSELIRRTENDDLLDSDFEGIDKLNPSVSNSNFLSQGHFDGIVIQKLSDNTPSPGSSEIVLVSLSLFDLANPPETVYRNSPQALFSCGDWRSYTDPSLFAGKNAHWLFPRSKEWKLRVKGSPFVKVSVSTNNFLLGISCFSIRDMAAVKPDELGISMLTRELMSAEGKYSGVIEFKYVLNVLQESNSIDFNRSSALSIDDKNISSILEKTFATEQSNLVHSNIQTSVISQESLAVGSHYTVINSDLSDVLPTGTDSLKDVEWPLSLKIFQIHVEDIPNQHWFVDNSLSVKLKTMTDLKVSSIQTNSGSFATWDDLDWDLRIHSRDDYIGIILSSGNKIIGTLKFSMMDLLSHRRSKSHGYLEISRKLQVKTNATLNTSIENAHGKVTLCLQIANIPSKQKKEKLLEICNKFFAEVSNESHIIAIIQPKLISVTGISTMFHDCMMTMVVGASKKQVDGDQSSNAVTIVPMNRPNQETTELIKNWNGNMLFNVEEKWKTVKIFDRLFIVFYLESKSGELIGSLSMSAFQIVTAPIDPDSRLAVVYGDLMIGLNSHGKFSITFERLDYDPDRPQKPPIIIDVVNDIERPIVWKIEQGKVINIVQVNANSLVSIHKTGKNSPLLSAEYRGLKYMTDSIPFGGHCAEWSEMNWPIECRDLGILKLKVSSNSVEIGTAAIPIRDLYELSLNEFGECEIEKPLMKGKQQRGILRVQFYLVESKLVKAKRIKMKALDDQQSIASSNTRDGEPNSVITHISEVEELHSKILAENIEQFKALFAKKRLFKSHQDASGVDENRTISSFSHFDDGSSFQERPDSYFGSEQLDDYSVLADKSIPQQNGSFQNQSIDETLVPSSASSYLSPNGQNPSVASADDQSLFSRHSSYPSTTFHSNSAFASNNMTVVTTDELSVASSSRPKTSRGDSVEPAKSLPSLEIRPIRGGILKSSLSSSDLSLLSPSQSTVEYTASLQSIAEDQLEKDDQFQESEQGESNCRPKSGESVRSDYIESSRPSTGYSSYSDYSTTSKGSGLTNSSFPSFRSSASKEISYADKRTVVGSIFSHSTAQSSRPISGYSDPSSSDYDSSYPTTSRSDYSFYSDYSDYSSMKKDFPYEQPDDEYRVTSRSLSSSRPVSGIHTAAADDVESLMNLDISNGMSHGIPSVNNNVMFGNMSQPPAVLSQPSNVENISTSSKQRGDQKRSIKYFFDLLGLQWIPSPVLDTVNVPEPKLDTKRVTLIVAETFISNIVDTVLGSFVAMSLGQDFDPKSFYCQNITKQLPPEVEFVTMDCRQVPTLQYRNTPTPWRIAILTSLDVVKQSIRIGASYAMSSILVDIEATRINQRKQENMKFLKRGGILMKRLDSPEYNLKGQSLMSSYKDNEDDFNIPLEKYYKQGVEAKFIPIKARFTVEDIIGIDLGVIDMRIMPTRPYITACRPGGNWAAETNPLKIELLQPTFNKDKDLLLNYYNLHTRFRWESFIMRRGQVMQMDLHDAGSGLIVAKCILPYEEILDTFPEKQHEFDSTVYVQFQISNEFGGGQVGGVMRVHVDLTVNLFSRSKKREDYWKEHRSQHWKNFPLTPICFGVVRQQYKEIAEAYDQQQVIHPAFYGFKIRMRGNLEDESKFIHPIFQGFFLHKKVFDTKVMSGKDTVAASAMKSNAGNPFRWDPTAHERNQCPVCVNGLIGCPRCFMMPIRPLDGLYFSPGEFAYDPDEERAKQLLQEQRLIKLATKKSRKLAAIKWMADIPQQLPLTKKDELIEGAKTFANQKEDDYEDSSATTQSVYSQMTEQIEKEYEEEVSQVVLSAEQKKIEKPSFHTNLTTYKSLRLYRIKVQCQMNIFVKVLPAGYIRRLTCESKDTVFQLYTRFNSQSAWGNSYNSRILMPTSIGLFELFPDLSVESDLMMADNRGNDRLEEFHMNEKNATYVLLFFKNYHAANVAGTLQGYFNKNTEHIIPRLPIYNGIDKLPDGKISDDPVQITLRNMVLTEYELQQKDVINEFLALGKSFRSSKEAQRQIEAAREKMQAKFIEDEKNALKLRLKSQIKQLKDLTPRSKKKAIEKLVEREGNKKKSRLLQSSSARNTTCRSSSSSNSTFDEDQVSLSNIVLDDQENEEEDSAEEDESLADHEEDEVMEMGRTSRTASTTASDYETNSEYSQTDGSSTARSNVSMSDIDIENTDQANQLEVGNEEQLPSLLLGPSVVGAVNALKQIKNLASDPVMEDNSFQFNDFDNRSFFADQERLEELFSRSECSGSIQDKDFYSQDTEEWDEDLTYGSTHMFTDSAASSQSRTGTSQSFWSDYSEDDIFSEFSSRPSTGRSMYSDYGSESVYSMSEQSPRSTQYTSRSSASSIATSATSFYSSSSFFTEGMTASTNSQASSTGSSLIPLDRFATQSYYLSKASNIQPLAASESNDMVPRLSIQLDGDSVGVYSHQYSTNDDSLESETIATSTDSQNTKQDSNEGLFTYRSNISTSTKASDISLVPSPNKLSHLSAESISRYASTIRPEMNNDITSVYSDRSRDEDEDMLYKAMQEQRSGSNYSSRSSTARSDTASRSSVSMSSSVDSHLSKGSNLFGDSKSISSSMHSGSYSSSIASYVDSRGSKPSFSEDSRLMMSKSLTLLPAQTSKSMSSSGGSVRYAGYGYIDADVPQNSLSSPSVASQFSQSKFVQKHINISKISGSQGEGSLARVEETAIKRYQSNSLMSRSDIGDDSRPSSQYSASSRESERSNFCNYSDEFRSNSRGSDYSEDASGYSGSFSSRSYYSSDYSGSYSSRSGYQSTDGGYTARSDYSEADYDSRNSSYSDYSRRSSFMSENDEYAGSGYSSIKSSRQSTARSMEEPNSKNNG